MRRRMMVLAALTALCAVTVLAIPLAVLIKSNYTRDERLELQQAAATVAARARGDALVAGTMPTVSDREIVVSVYDAAGRKLAGPGPTTADTTARAALAGKAASRTTSSLITVAAAVTDGDQVIAAIYLTTSLDAARQRTIRAWVGLASMCVGAVAVSVLVAYVWARRLTRPIDRLGRVAEEIGAGNLAARAEPSGVNELDRLGQTLNDSAGRLADLFQRERSFSAEVSHQLRTPISRLRLNLEAADRALTYREGGPLDEAASVAIADSLAATDQLNETIADIIRLARDVPRRERVEVRALLATLTERWHTVLADDHRPLRVGRDADAPDTLGLSAAAAQQVLDVLLDNALRHGQGAVHVRVRVIGPSDAVEVSDEGPPVHAEPWELFGPRPRDSDEQRDGRGLGLPYARRLAEAEGARLVLSRTTPTTFSLLVPSAENLDETA